MTKKTQTPTTLVAKPSIAAQNNLTVSQHINELRSRLLWSAFCFLLVGTAVYMFHDFFVRLLMRPLGEAELVYLSPAGGFSFIFSVTLYVALVLTMPVFLYQIYAFVRPAVSQHGYRTSLGVGVTAAALMAGGVAFGYLFAVPAGLNFLMHFADQYVTASLTAEAYLRFVLLYVFGMGVLFEAPLLLLLLHWARPLTPRGLLRSERFAILVAFILGAVLSPTPDIINQAIIAVPVLLLYQLGVVAVLVSLYRQHRRTMSGRQQGN